MLSTVLLTSSLILMSLVMGSLFRSRQARRVRVPVRIQRPVLRRIDHENN
jgi:hypothetical protein